MPPSLSLSLLRARTPCVPRTISDLTHRAARPLVQAPLDNLVHREARGCEANGFWEILRPSEQQQLLRECLSCPSSPPHMPRIEWGSEKRDRSSPASSFKSRRVGEPHYTYSSLAAAGSLALTPSLRAAFAQCERAVQLPIPAVATHSSDEFCATF